jgi:hypothetical protein
LVNKNIPTKRRFNSPSPACHGDAVDSFSRVWPQTLANEACATKDSDHFILIRRGSGATAVGAAAAPKPNRSKRQLYTLATAPKDLRRLAHR